MAEPKKQPTSRQQLQQAARIIDDLTMRLGQKDLHLGRAEAMINWLNQTLQARDDEIRNLKLDLEKLRQKEARKKAKTAGKGGN